MSLDSARTDKQERRQIAHLHRYRALRQLVFWVAVPWAIIKSVVALFGQSVGNLAGLGQLFPWYAVGILLAITFVTHLKVRHIESVKLRVDRRRFGQCPQCGYDLYDNIDQGCSECGSHRAD